MIEILHIPQVHLLALCSSNKSQNSLQPCFSMWRCKIIYIVSIFLFTFTLALLCFHLPVHRDTQKQLDLSLKDQWDPLGQS